MWFEWTRLKVSYSLQEWRIAEKQSWHPWRQHMLPFPTMFFRPWLHFLAKWKVYLRNHSPKRKLHFMSYCNLISLQNVDYWDHIILQEYELYLMRLKSTIIWVKTKIWVNAIRRIWNKTIKLRVLNILKGCNWLGGWGLSSFVINFRIITI